MTLKIKASVTLGMTANYGISWVTGSLFVLDGLRLRPIVRKCATDPEPATLIRTTIIWAILYA